MNTVKMTKYADVDEVFQDTATDHNVGQLIPVWDDAGDDRKMVGTGLIIGVVVAPDGRSMEIELEIQ